MHISEAKRYSWILYGVVAILIILGTSMLYDMVAGISV